MIISAVRLRRKGKLSVLDLTAIKKGEVRVAKTIIIKNFPEDLHRKAKAKAALEGITLKALIIKLLETYLEEFRI